MNSFEEDRLSESYLIGTVLHIIFRNEENGYTVIKVKVKESEPALDEKKVTVVGHFPAIEKEERYRFEGELKEHPRYGKQYQAYIYKKDLPTEREALISYLSSERFTGIGKKTAERLIDTYGTNVISGVLNQPDKLKEIPGLNEEKRKTLYRELMENQGMEHAMTMLSRFGFGMELSVKIYNTYKEETIDIIQHTPYQLVWDVEGVGFYKADRLGKSLGIQPNDQERVKAGLLYVLYEKTMQEGHVYFPRREVLKEAQALLNEGNNQVDVTDLDTAVLQLVEEDKLIEEEERIYIPSLYFAEKGVVTKVTKMLEEDQRDVFSESEFLQALGETEEEFGIEYAEQQREAIYKAIHSNIMILTGGPGTGKTTVIRAIVDIYAKLNGFSLDRSTYRKGERFPVLLAAPTGRAAKRMKESTGLEASTIHKLLGFNGEEEEDPFEKNEQQPLEGSLLIVDEVSMVDMWLANQLLRAVPDEMKVIIVGDEDQLPSVGPGQVLRDLLQTKLIPTVELSVVYRQAEGSSIIDLAHTIKKGYLPDDMQTPYSDRRFFPCSKLQTAQVIEQVCAGALKKGYSPLDIQVLAPMYRGSAGVNLLNETLQKLFNPHEEKKRKVSFGDTTYSKGDVVLQLVNDPEKEVYNGDRGVIEAIFEAKETVDKQMQIVISFEGKEVTYSRQELKQIMLAYCSSIHKAQGSEFPIVIVPMLMSYRRMLQRNLLYTAITRAQDYLILCGEREAIQFAVDKDNRDGRFTTLVEKFLHAAGESPS
ncbi:SF1B family DNA helicase RecD2 [Alteribacillus iranensis]|uniref:ATP-dependent RecD2 DNA helicase n=1 Tax=Alteribacillus iranensis TaxID=930128 RepID=A0A1I1ZBE5_9BACI|nr:ATP-dependent RecD-like DNA helicase [Alteribacillus iranensis]SFE27660.1 exodeoxyribonuclease V alpha subunit [Alteribacillus iranensis]